MNKRFWPGLLLIVPFLPAPPIATAQPPRLRTHFNVVRTRPVKQSHHDLPGGLDLDNPQEMMAQRLQQLHELHQLQDQVQGLLKDPVFLKNIQHLPEEELRQLREKLLRGEGLGQDQGWHKFLEQAAAHQKLDQRQIDILRRWAERVQHKDPSFNGSVLLNGRGPAPPIPPSSPMPSSSSATPSLAAADNAEPSLLDRMQEETTKWMIEHLDDVGGDVLKALNELGPAEESAPLAELLRSMRQPDFSDMNVGEPAMGLSNYLSKVGELVHEQRGAWDEVQSIFRESSSLPSFGNSLPSAPERAADRDAALPLMSMVMLATIVVLLCKMAARSQVQTSSGDAEPWCLGPWPVSPRAVATRQDVIRAFEYLALLCLGPSAGTCHHRELAERIAEQNSGNPARRQAAEMLACFYEQARYAPAGEALSQEELSDARQALCYL
ncbi:MAG TPA: hypothetical protein VMG10_30920, partial [Gemmataceae bacterium]|nr:hypothetical protein [Gemmataceae bacterium]